MPGLEREQHVRVRVLDLASDGRATDGVEQVADHRQPGALLVVGAHADPGGGGGVGAHQHLVAGLGVGIEPLLRLDVHRTGLELLERVGASLLEPRLLLLARDVEPQLDQDDAGLRQHSLEPGHIEQELLGLLRRAEVHHLLDARAVVPGAVEHHPFAAGRQVAHIALEVPFGGLAVGRLGQGDHAGVARRQVLGHPLDGAVLAGGVAALEDDQRLLALADRPDLRFDQVDLQPPQVVVVLFFVHPSTL